MKFTHLHLQNFGPHADTKIDMAPLTVVRGVNASGKSHIEDALTNTELEYISISRRAALALYKAAGAVKE